MDLKFNLSDGVVYGTMEGRLDTIAAQATNTNEFLDNADKKIVFDCTNLSFISSAGLRLLLALYKACRVKGGSITMKSVSSSVMRVFEVSGFASMLTFE